MCKSAIIIMLLAMPGVLAGEVDQSQYFGEWTSVYPATRGEANTLRISSESGATFVRDFGGDPQSQNFETSVESLIFVDDILILDFTESQSEATYKLVLAEFESPQNDTLLKGTVYMYLEGKLVNGMHISMRKLQ